MGGRGARGGGGSNKMGALEKKVLEYGAFEFDRFVQENKTLLQKEDKFTFEKAQEVWRETRYADSIRWTKPMTKEEAIEVMREKMPASALTGWFRDANSDYKPRIEELTIGDRQLRSAALNIAHKNFEETTGRKMSYAKFLNTEIPVYRGGNNDKFVASDVFKSYSFDRKIAEKFGSNVQSIKIKPKDTLGSFQTTGEAEILVPVR